MALSVAAARSAKFSFFPNELQQLARGRQSPVSRDLEARSVRVEQRMKQNASGRPGPNIRTSTLRDSITTYAGEDTQSIWFRIGPRPVAVFKRGYNYALILEGIFPRGGAPPDGKYPFMAKSLDAAR